MRLYELKRGDLFKLSSASDANFPPVHRQPGNGETFVFSRLEGMYSFCFDSHGNAIHPAGYCEVEKITGN